MKRGLILSCVSLFSFLLMLACGKGGTEIYDDGTTGGEHGYVPNDTTAPVISILSPSANQVFTNGSIINISGNISDDYGLYRGTVRITNDANGTNVFNQPYEIHGILSYNFNLNHTANVGMETWYTVTVSFEDHGLNSVTKSVKIKVTP